MHSFTRPTILALSKILSAGLKENFSHTTITIALMLADKALNHQPLIINGSPDFHKAVLQVALENNLSISFHDKLMQGTFELRKREKETEIRKFLAAGGKIVTKRPKSQSRIHPARAKTIEEAIKTGFHLSTLSQLPSLSGESEGIKLTEDEVRDLDEFMREQYQRVRYDFSHEQKRLAQLTAKKILENVQEALKQQSAISHAEYIKSHRPTYFLSSQNCGNQSIKENRSTQKFAFFPAPPSRLTSGKLCGFATLNP